MRALQYLQLSKQYLRLAHEASLQLVATGNPFFVTSATPISEGEYSARVRWADHSIGTAVLFNQFHGFELVMKGFLAHHHHPRFRAHKHRLLRLLGDFEILCPRSALGAQLAVCLRQIDPASPIGRFLASNGLTIEDWYDALKYPESFKGAPVDHFDLKFGGGTTLPFWQSVADATLRVHNEAVDLANVQGIGPY